MWSTFVKNAATAAAGAGNTNVGAGAVPDSLNNAWEDDEGDSDIDDDLVDQALDSEGDEDDGTADRRQGGPDRQEEAAAAASGGPMIGGAGQLQEGGEGVRHDHHDQQPHEEEEIEEVHERPPAVGRILMGGFSRFVGAVGKMAQADDTDDEDDDYDYEVEEEGGEGWGHEDDDLEVSENFGVDGDQGDVAAAARAPPDAATAASTAAAAAAVFAQPQPPPPQGDNLDVAVGDVGGGNAWQDDSEDFDFNVDNEEEVEEQGSGSNKNKEDALFNGGGVKASASAESAATPTTEDVNDGNNNNKSDEFYDAEAMSPPSGTPDGAADAAAAAANAMLTMSSGHMPPQGQQFTATSPHNAFVDSCPVTPQRQNLAGDGRRIVMVVDRTPPASPFRNATAAAGETAGTTAAGGGILDAKAMESMLSAIAANDDGGDDGAAGTDASLACRANSEDLTRDTGAIDDSIIDEELEVFDDEDEMAYAPVVDHTPVGGGAPGEKAPPSGQNSLAVQFGTQSQVGEGWEVDDDVDDLDDEPYSEIADADGTAGQAPTVPDVETTKMEHIVDFTPEDGADGGADADLAEMQGRGMPRNASVGVLASEVDSTQVEQENASQFGPVVDRTPVPSTQTLGGLLSAANSIAVQAMALQDDFDQDDVMDETYYGDSTDGWDQDDDLDNLDAAVDIQAAAVRRQQQQHPGNAGTDPSSSLASEMSGRKSEEAKETAPKGTGDHVVDHLPQEVTDPCAKDDGGDPSVAVLINQEDMTRDTGGGSNSDVYEDEDEMEFIPVVDQTPTTPNVASVATVSGSNSVGVLAPEINEEIKEDDAMDETAFDDDDDGWERDDDIVFEEGKQEQDESDSKRPGVTKQVTIVDHTPSEMGTPSMKVSDASVDVLPSEATSTKPGDNDSAGGEADFGLVVDQTPQTPAPTLASARSDSVVVQVPDLETVDETYADDDQGDGGDTIDSEMPTALKTLEDKLVDHIPLRPASRIGDASILVAADPSEVLSEADQEDGSNFGPVVDVTPPSRPATITAGVPSGAGSTVAGSTVVFAPASVAADDLDGDREGDAEGDEDEDIEAQAEDNGWEDRAVDVEGAPNPQSGNEEEQQPAAANEQMVDFLPPQDEGQDDRDRSLRGREASSEVTLRGEQSTIMPNLDQDDFGPVVDLTPVPQPVVAPRSGLSNASTSTQVTASECRALEKEDETEVLSSTDLERGRNKSVEDLSQIRLPVDSTASLGGSQLAEDEELEPDASKFGPVVDHLPTPRNSLAPSRGGSTVDALATVSEVNSDEEGWDDDGDMDVSESGVISDGSALQRAAATRFAFRQSASSDHERSVSVRFEASIDDCQQSPESGAGTGLLSQTHYYDPEMGVNQAFAEAETPPSTPYRKPQSVSKQPFVLDEAKVGTVECRTCDNAKAIECPCVQKLLRSSNSENGALIGSIVTAEGETLEIDFSKMLQDEITKRKFVEDEVQSCRRESAFLTAKESQLETKIESLQESHSALELALAAVKEEGAKLRSELKSSTESLSSLEQSKAAWSARESALQAEVQNLKLSLDESVARLSSDGDITREMTLLQSELASKAGECEQLRTQITHLQSSFKDANTIHEAHKVEIQDLLEKLKEATTSCELKESNYKSLLKSSEAASQKAEAYSLKIKTLASELQNVRKSNDELAKTVEDLRTNHEAEMQQQYKLLDRKTVEIRTLESTMKSLEGEKIGLVQELGRQRTLAEQSESLATELLSVAKERDLLQESLAESKEAVDSLQKIVDEHGMEQQAIDSRRDAEVASLKSEVQGKIEALAEKEEEANALLAKMEIISGEKETLRKELQQVKLANQSLEETAASLKTRCAQAEDVNANAANEITLLRDQATKLTSDLKHAEAERQKGLSHLAALGRTLERAEKESETKTSKIKELDDLILQVRGEVLSLTNERDTLAKERDSLLSTIKDKEVELAQALEQSQEQQQQLVEKYQHETRELRSRHQEVLAQLAKEQSQSQGLTAERNALEEKCKEIEEALAQASRIAEERWNQLHLQYESETAKLKGAQQDLHQQLSQQRSMAESVTVERDALLKQKEELEQASAQSADTAKKQLQQATQTTEQKLRDVLEANARLEEKLKAASEELVHSRNDLEQVSQERDALNAENEEMLVQFGVVEQEMNASEEQVKFLQQQVEAIHGSEDKTEQIAALGNELQRLTGEMSAVSFEKSQLEAMVKSLTEEKAILEARVQALESESGKTFSAEIRLKQVSEACQQQQEKIRMLEDDSASKQQAAEESASVAASTQEKLSFKEAELESSLRNAAILEERIQKLEETNKEIGEQLGMANDQLAANRATQANLADYKADLEDLEGNGTSHEASQTIADYEKRMKKLESDLLGKNQLVAQLQDSVRTLQGHIESQASLNLSHTDLGLPTVRGGGERSEELDSLKKQLESLEASLQETRTRLVAKEDEVDRLSLELTSLQCRGANLSATAVDGHNASIEDVDTLRSHVVSLAVALERSETRRAEAISRLLAERENNASSLRKLSDSVKRFYSSVSH